MGTMPLEGSASTPLSKLQLRKSLAEEEGTRVPFFYRPSPLSIIAEGEAKSTLNTRHA